jgi:hypothetical protein
MRERLASRYDRIWRAAVVLLATIGLAAAIVFVGLSTNLVAFLVAAAVAGAAALQVGLARELPSADLIRSTPRLAVLGGLLVLAICGFAAAVGLETLVLVGLIITLSPPVLARLRPAARQPAEPMRQPQDVPLPSIPTPRYLSAVARSLCELSDEEICLAWRRSFTRLQNPSTAEHRSAMADVRRAYLDELERRSPDAFAAWIQSGARAAGDPAKFFIPHTS